MSVEELIRRNVAEAVKYIYSQDISESIIQIQNTEKQFKGDITVVIFPLLKYSKKSPEDTGKQIGAYLEKNIHDIIAHNVIKGFLNLTISDSYWLDFINEAIRKKDFGFKTVTGEPEITVVEFSSPNTNKPLHLGHIRNNLIGHSICEILKANGNRVITVNLVNDRGIHICKSMLAWIKWGNGETPASSGMKGDKLVGKYYVLFETESKKEIEDFLKQGFTEAEARKRSALLSEAQDMLIRWESKDPDIHGLWETMNGWVYEGFKQTYKKLGITFDKTYYESQTYESGKSIILTSLEKGLLFRKEDNSVWIDLAGEKLDNKLLLRSDGTSVYMTQDIGTICQRYKEYRFNRHIYVVGNEQNYHFHALFLILKKMGFEWAEHLEHKSYGMVELPEGKMKSREGTVVDADDLIEEMNQTAREMSRELGKLEDISDTEKENIFHTIALGALKYFILKVDPQKNMLFNPKESIDFNGNTGAFIQYTYARIRSVFRKAQEQKIKPPKTVSLSLSLNLKEKNLIRLIYNYPCIIEDAANNLSPALLTNFVYELTKEYNQFYHDYSILKETSKDLMIFRLLLSGLVANVIQSATKLLGMDLPERM